MKKTVELSVDTSDIVDMFGIGVHVILDNDSLGSKKECYNGRYGEKSGKREKTNKND